MMTRIAITGMGGIAAIGNTSQEIMQGISSGRRGINHIQGFDSRYFPLTAAAEVAGINLAPGVEKKRILLGKAIQDLLTNNSVFHQYRPEDRIFNLGSGVDYLDLPGYIADENGRNWSEHIKNSYDVAQDFAVQYALMGGVHVNVSACVASNQAIGLGYRLLKQTPGKLVIAGGVDSMVDPLGYIGFYKLGALTTWEGDIAGSCRPFDRQRCGVVLGEGATLFQLQSMAEADPDRVLAEIVGYGTSMDAYLITDPLPTGAGLAQAARAAIEDAGLTPADIDCVHLHGTGTPKNGMAESNTMRLIFGGRFSDVPVFGFKGQIGHLIGACGAVEILGVLYSLLQQQVPVTINYEEPDPDVPLRVITREPLKTDIRYVLKLNAAFGGQNSALVFKRATHD